MSTDPDSTICSARIPGEPVAKGRPRAVRRGPGIAMVTPQRTRAYEDSVAWHALQDTRRGSWPISGPLRVTILAVHKRPGNLFRKKDHDGRIWRPRKPDADNIAKAVIDGLTKAGLWQDDGQVVDLNVLQCDGAIVDRKAKTSEGAHVVVKVARTYLPACPGCTRRGCDGGAGCAGRAG